jgi:hypothetical protein
LLILSSIIIQCSSFSEKEFLGLKERIGLLAQDVYNDVYSRLKNLEQKYESLTIDMGDKNNDFDEGKC